MAVNMCGRLRAERRAWHVIVRQVVQFVAPVEYPFGHEVDDALGAALNLPFDEEQTRAHDLPAELFKKPRPDDDICDACLVTERDEDDAGIAGHLTHQHNPGATRSLAIGRLRDVIAGPDTLRMEQVA